MRTVVGAVLVAGLLLAPTLAKAEEPRGCDKFKWPVIHEQSALLSTQKHLASGESLAIDAAGALRLVPFKETRFEMPPGRVPKDPSTLAGILKIEAPKAAGAYKVTLSDGAWIDVLQAGKVLKSEAFSGAQDCPGVRKTVKFHLDAAPVTLQLSDAKVQELSVIVSPE